MKDYRIKIEPETAWVVSTVGVNIGWYKGQIAADLAAQCFSGRVIAFEQNETIKNRVFHYLFDGEKLSGAIEKTKTQQPFEEFFDP